MILVQSFKSETVFIFYETLSPSLHDALTALSRETGLHFLATVSSAQPFSHN